MCCMQTTVVMVMSAPQMFGSCTFGLIWVERSQGLGYCTSWTNMLYSWRIKDQLDVTYYFISLLTCSTCFGHKYIHHQEHATILLNYHIGRVVIGSMCVVVSVWLGWSGICVAVNMFRTLIYPSSGACDYSVELPHWSYCSWFFVCWRFVVVGLSF